MAQINGDLNHRHSPVIVINVRVSRFSRSSKVLLFATLTLAAYLTQSGHGGTFIEVIAPQGPFSSPLPHYHSESARQVGSRNICHVYSLGADQTHRPVSYITTYRLMSNGNKIFMKHLFVPRYWSTVYK
jgi:hypothetical protein